MTATTQATAEDVELFEGIFQRVSADLGMIIDREISCESISTERLDARPEARGCVHISFKLGLQIEQHVHHGCLLVPLPEAISMAAYLMMMPDGDVVAQRESTELDRMMKDAMLEVGNFIAGACDAVIRQSGPEGANVRSEGCQGVRADVRPALTYNEGDELVVGRTTARIHEFPAFEMILMLPSPGLAG